MEPAENTPIAAPEPDPPVIPQATDQPADHAEAEAAPSESQHTRTGKVARLPKEIRDQVNQMLLDGVPFRKIIENLGEHGKEITEKNITNWKQGGHQDWLLDLERKDALAITRDAALDLVKEKAGITVQDASRTVASAQLYQLLLAFDPTAFATALADKPELYIRLISAIARLSEGEAICSHQRAKESHLKTKTEAAKSGGVVTQDTLKEIARLITLI